MKRFLLLVLLGSASLLAKAQRVYFVYLQSESGTPFYLKMSDKVHSSTGAGYLILPGLKDSSYQFAIGFPGKTGEHRFRMEIRGADRGFLLKALDGELNLFDLQTLSLSREIAGLVPASGPPSIDMATVDPFTKLLALAVDDPSLLAAEPVAMDLREEKKDIAAAVQKELPPARDTLAIVMAPVTGDTNNITAAAVVALPFPVIVDTSSRAVSDTVMVQTEPGAVSGKDSLLARLPATDTAVIAGAGADTLKVNTAGIPVAAVIDSSLSAVKDTIAVSARPFTDSVQVAPVAEVYSPSKVWRRSESSTTEGFGLVFIDDQGTVVDTIRLLIPNPRAVAPMAVPVPVTVDTTSAGRVMNAAARVCPGQAGESEFLALRRAMVAESGNTDMLAVAAREFEKLCFSTEQVRNLGVLFLEPAAKFQFFQAVQFRVSDPGNFGTLGSEFRDELFLQRFKALLGE